MSPFLRIIIFLCSILTVTNIPFPSAANQALHLLRGSLIECVQNYYQEGSWFTDDDWDYCSVSEESLFHEQDAESSIPGLQIYIIYVLRQAANALNDSGPEYNVRSNLNFCADTYDAGGPWSNILDWCSSHGGRIFANDMLHLSIKGLTQILND